MGETFGEYELVRRVGVGGMAEIFLANRTNEVDATKRQVAIKRIFPHLVDEEEIVNMFLDEARLAQSLTHPNIVQIYDLGQVDDSLYIAMEYVHGADLRAVAERGFDAGGFLPIPLAVLVTASAAAGLHFAHIRKDSSGNPLNIVHRDVSPQNILVGMNGNVKMCDFGIAKAERRLAHTQAGQVKGKYAYMSPEQIESADVDARSDVFALGIVLYETTTRSRLFKGDTEIETIRKVATQPIEPPHTVRPEINPELSDIIVKALDRNPAKRHQTARELQMELVNWLTTHSSQTTDSHLAAHMSSIFPELVEEQKSFVEESTKPIMMTPEMFEQLDAGASIESLASQAAAAEEPPALDDEPDETVIDDRSPEDILLEASINASPADHLRETSQNKAIEAPSLDMESLPLPSLNPDSVSGDDDDAPPAAVETLKPNEPTVVETPPPDPNFATPNEPTVVTTPAPTQPAETEAPRIATRPPGKFTPPPRAAASTSTEVENYDDHDDVGDLDDWKPAKGGRGILPVVVVIVAIVLIGGFLFVMLNTESALQKEAEETQKNKELLDQPIEQAALEMSDVQVNTTPEGAALIVNGIRREGKTIPLVTSGENEIIAYLPGHAPRRTVVSGSSSATINLELTPLEVEPDTDLQIISEPRGANIFVDGQPAGQTPTTVQLSSKVEHHVSIEMDGKFGYAGFIGLVSGSENVVNAQLFDKDSGRKNYVEAKFAALPRGTMIKLDAKPFAMTPTFKNIPRNTHVAVEFSGIDSMPMSRIVTMHEVGTMELRPFLKKAKREKGFISVSVTPEGADLYIGNSQYGQGPVEKLELPEGKIKVVLDTPDGRVEQRIEVIANTHTKYELKLEGTNATVHKL